MSSSRPLRILHFADLHIGVESYSRTDPATGLPSRLLDTLRAFDELVEAAIAEQVDLVLFCGDAYRSRDPSQTHQREFARRIARLREAGVPVFLLAGNHDLPNAFGRATALEIFETLDVSGVTVASRPGTYRVETRGGIVQVVALPWMRRNAVLAHEETRGMTLDQINDYIQETLATVVRREAEALDPALPALLAAHATVSTARVGSERSMMLGHDYVLLPSHLADPRLDYVALGHIHGHQRLWESPPVVYAGSVHRVDFSEEDQPKGFCLVEMDSEKPQGQRTVGWRFREVWSRPFVTVSVSVPPDDPDPAATVRQAIQRREVAEAVVRVLVKLPAEQQGRLDQAEVRQVLAEAHVVAGVHVEVERETRTRLGRGVSVEALTPLEGLRLYLESRGTAPARQATLLQYAQALLRTEDASLGYDVGDEETSGQDSISGIIVRLTASPKDMEEAYAVRRRVFVEEQGIDPAIEWDGQDEDAVHAIASLDGEIVGTGRLVVRDEEGRIGRMAVLPEWRRGIGGRILLTLEEEALRRGLGRITLHAQSYVKEFYQGHGYREEGTPFLEAGIEHVAMWKALE